MLPEWFPRPRGSCGAGMTPEQVDQWNEAIRNIYLKVVIPQVSVERGAVILSEIDQLMALAKQSASSPMARTAQMKEIPHGCPSCGALPCDWVNTPTIEQSSIVQNEAEIVRLTKERDDALAEVEETRKSVEPSFNAGFHLGTAQMREKAVGAIETCLPDAPTSQQNDLMVYLARAIRALPLEEK